MIYLWPLIGAAASRAEGGKKTIESGAWGDAVGGGGARVPGVGPYTLEIELYLIDEKTRVKSYQYVVDVHRGFLEGLLSESPST